MNREDFRHFYKLPVRWNDADQLGHINNVKFFRYIECGRVDYCEQAMGIIYTTDMKEGWVLADIQCSFQQQLHYPCEIEIASRISRIGNSSAEMLAAIFRVGESTPVATSKGIVVWLDFIEQVNKRVPDEYREKIVDYEILPPASSE